MTRRKPSRPRLMLKNCPGCHVPPGKVHDSLCSIERCSVCGEPRHECIKYDKDNKDNKDDKDDPGCRDHDPLFARWTGLLPGAAEAYFLNTTLEIYCRRFSGRAFVKPHEPYPKYTVLLLFPEPMSEEQGLETYVARVAANDPATAVAGAQREVYDNEIGKFERLVENKRRPKPKRPIRPRDFTPLLILAGWHRIYSPIDFTEIRQTHNDP